MLLKKKEMREGEQPIDHKRTQEKKSEPVEREPWPTGLFDCCSGFLVFCSERGLKIYFFLFEKGGISLCLWGFLCPVALFEQGHNFGIAMSLENSLTESQFDRYPPWSCRDIELCAFICLATPCFSGFILGSKRHRWKHFENFEFYCSSQKGGCCCCSMPIEDCLIGHFCCGCSIIQMTMAQDEIFRMKSAVEGDLNIKHAR